MNEKLFFSANKYSQDMQVYSHEVLQTFLQLHFLVAPSRCCTGTQSTAATAADEDGDAGDEKAEEEDTYTNTSCLTRSKS